MVISKFGIFLPLPVSNINSFLLTKRNKNLLAKHYFGTSTILSSEICSSNCAEKLPFTIFFFKNVIIKQLQREKKGKKAKSAQLKVLPKLIKKLKGLKIMVKDKIYRVERLR